MSYTPGQLQAQTQGQSQSATSSAYQPGMLRAQQTQAPGVLPTNTASEKKPFLKQVAKDLLNVPARASVNVGGIAATLAGRDFDPTKPVNLPFMGETYAIGRGQTFSNPLAAAKDAVGTGLEGASLVAGGGVAARALAAPGILAKMGQGARLAVPGGAASGALYGAGREMQNPDSTVGSIAREGALGGVIGAAGGAVTGGALSGALGVIAGGSFTRNAAQKALQRVNAVGTDDAIIKQGTDALIKSIPDTRVFNTQIGRISSRQGKTPEQLMEDLVRSNYLPEYKMFNRNFKFDESLARNNTQRDEIMGAYETLARSHREVTRLDDLEQQAIAALRNHPTTITGELSSAEARLAQLFENYRRANPSGEVDPVGLTKILREVNKQTRAYDSKEGLFQQDTHNAIGSAIRQRLDSIDPNFSEINKQWGHLTDMRQTMQTLQDRPIDMPYFASAAGRYYGTVLGAGMGGLGAGTGSGSLVIAGVLATLGADAMASIIRKQRFPNKLRQRLQEIVADNPDLADRIRQNASLNNVRYLLGTGDTEGPRSSVGGGRVIPVAPQGSTVTFPRSNQVGGDAPTQFPRGN